MPTEQAVVPLAGTGRWAAGSTSQMEAVMKRPPCLGCIILAMGLVAFFAVPTQTQAGDCRPCAEICGAGHTGIWCPCLPALCFSCVDHSCSEENCA